MTEDTTNSPKDLMDLEWDAQKVWDIDIKDYDISLKSRRPYFSFDFSFENSDRTFSAIMGNIDTLADYGLIIPFENNYGVPRSSFMDYDVSFDDKRYYDMLMQQGTLHVDESEMSEEDIELFNQLNGEQLLQSSKEDFVDIAMKTIEDLIYDDQVNGIFPKQETPYTDDEDRYYADMGDDTYE